MTRSSSDPDVQAADEALVGPGEFPETRPVQVEAREGFAIWIEFADGSNGGVDLAPLAPLD